MYISFPDLVLQPTTIYQENNNKTLVDEIIFHFCVMIQQAKKLLRCTEMYNTGKGIVCCVQSYL